MNNYIKARPIGQGIVEVRVRDVSFTLNTDDAIPLMRQLEDAVVDALKGQVGEQDKSTVYMKMLESPEMLSGSELKILRIRAGISQAEMADRLGHDNTSYVSLIENERRNVSKLFRKRYLGVVREQMEENHKHGEKEV